MFLPCRIFFECFTNYIIDWNTVVAFLRSFWITCQWFPVHDADKCTPITCFDVPSPDVQSSQCHQWLKNLHSSCYVRSCGSIQCRVMRVCIDRNPAHGTGASKWRRLLVSVSKRKLDRLGLGYHHRIQGSRPSPANVSCQWYTWDHQTARITIRNKRKTWFAF